MTVHDNAAAPQNVIKLIDADGSQLREIATVAPNKGAFKKVDSLAESLTQNAELLTAQLATALGIQAARWTNLRGRQRMLPQRLAKCAFALMGAPIPRTARSNSMLRAQFSTALGEL